MDATAAEPTQQLNGRESLAPVFDNLNTYAATMHFNGQSTMMIASIRYLDEFVKQNGQWLFAERRWVLCAGAAARPAALVLGPRARSPARHPLGTRRHAPPGQLSRRA
jgi:hypothetical protein